MHTFLWLTDFQILRFYISLLCQHPGKTELHIAWHYYPVY